MFILGSGEYVPTRVVDNAYFARLTGRPVEWFTQRTGILERRRAAGDENVNTMATAAVHSLIEGTGLSLEGVDLIIAVSYTPLDTIATIAHVLQRQFELRGARALYLSTACSSFMDALDVAQAYFDAGRARKALVVASEHNSAFSRDEDERSGHLWGDGAAALLLSAARERSEFEVVDVHTQGLGHLGDGPASISLNPATNGLVMRHGKQVFAHACHEMAAATRSIVAKNGLDIAQIRLFVPHQANKRIIDHVAEDLELPADRAAVTISELGNTGCASVAITLHRFGRSVPAGEHIVLVTFGGGYSAGAALLRRSH
jgi:3-oxoacyl-[acyl-carrier-protein] synthase III